MNPAYIARDWATKIAEQFDFRVQVEIGDTSDYHFVVVAIGSKQCRIESIVFTRQKTQWWPLCVGEVQIASESAFKKYLASLTESVKEQCRQC